MPGSGAAGLDPERLPLCGVVLLDKPQGPTSHDMVYLLRRLAGIKKVGHGGTLDPFATGLLLMLTGKATRLFDLLAPLKKEYLVLAQFGSVSTTGDVGGEIEPLPAAAPVSAAGLMEILPRFTGIIEQRPHRYSAVKVGGEPLYRKARRGEAAQAEPRPVEIGRLDLAAFDEEKQQGELLVKCSGGTYIRSLVEDIAAALGTGAYALKLRRNAIGGFRVEDASTPQQLEGMERPRLLSAANPSFLSCLGALYFLPVKEVDENEARAVLTGRPLTGDATQPVRIDYRGNLLAVYGPAGTDGLQRPLMVLA